ncbi:hypothetical protein [Nocardiopsis sp. LOL_012]|uniref:hypothetical protein n=1 Tax=Nocardiopsis sp. LOL_012 TaxID=3345409 RepID=UPI003A8B6DE7
MTDRQAELHRKVWRDLQKRSPQRPYQAMSPPVPPPRAGGTGTVNVPVVIGVCAGVVVLLFLAAHCDPSDGGGESTPQASDTARTDDQDTWTAPQQESGTVQDDEDPQGAPAPELGDVSGVWEGPAQGDQDWYSVRLDIAPAAGDGWSIGIDYPELGCGGTVDLTGTESGGDVLVGVERLEYGLARCTDGGDVRVHRDEAGGLYWEWISTRNHIWADLERTGEPGATIPVIPASAAGEWSGEISQTNLDDPFPVTAVLEEGSRSATLELPDSGCLGDLTLLSDQGGTLEFSLAFNDGSRCVDGTVLLVPDGAGALGYTWSSGSGPRSEGTLYAD